MTAATLDIDMPCHIDVPRLIHLELDVRDPETIVELSRHDDCDARESYAVSDAKALAVRQERAATKTAADFTEVESAVSRIANNAKMLHDINTHATTVKNSGQKILEKTDKVREDLEKQIERLQEHLGRLKADVITDTTAN